MSESVIYLDHAAATPLDRRVFQAMEPYFSDLFYNPSSPYAPAVNVRRDYEEAKHILARSIGGKSDEIVVTAGATESVNLAFNSIGGHVITANIEHHAVLEAAKHHEHTIIQSDERGTIAADRVKEAITPATRLVSVG